MRKLLEVQNNEDIKKSQFINYGLTLLVASLFILVHASERNFFDFSFYLEGFFVFTVLRFYGKSHKNKNYAFWGLTVLLFIYLTMTILEFTFVSYNIFILYFSFLAFIFLMVNSYIMSSPLYYPRIQWWEYDFRYAGELKATARVNGLEFESRVADLRRNAASILAFDVLPLGAEMQVEIPYEDKVFKIIGTITTQREVIAGRPMRYGITLDESKEPNKSQVPALKKIWKSHKRANLRRKFSDHKESNGL
ncbi:MAG: hypothetical protein CME62_03005 [Halobacteriovoraceae bacterium]|nr:hypothetical protein [Halobacteriovoraceae bacterium]|tara:strand:+ start:1702 stop:2451 length:750 start_codon:yes stop_codon:yes gene_type:complete